MMSDAEWTAFETGVKPLHLRQASQAVRRRLFREQGGICGVCGLPMEFVHFGPWQGRPSTDHVLPKSLGGMDRVGNLICAHAKCNADKQSRMPTGCELIWLLAVNNRLGVEPQKW